MKNIMIEKSIMAVITYIILFSYVAVSGRPVALGTLRPSDIPNEMLTYDIVTKNGSSIMPISPRLSDSLTGVGFPSTTNCPSTKTPNGTVCMVTVNIPWIMGANSEKVIKFTGGISSLFQTGVYVPTRFVWLKTGGDGKILDYEERNIIYK